MVGPVKPFNPNPGQKPRLRPGLQVPSTTDPELQNFLGVLTEYIEQHEGNRGQPEERFVTLQELKDAGLIDTVIKNRRAEIGSDAESGKAATTEGVTQAALAISTKLGELQDVLTTGNKQGDVIQYRASINKWQRTPVAGVQSAASRDDMIYLKLGSGGLEYSHTEGKLTWNGTILCISGAEDINNTASAFSAPALKIDINAGAFGGIKAESIAWFTADLSLGNDDAAILIDIDQRLATGGNVAGLHMLATVGAATELPGIQVGSLVSPVLQLSGVYGNAATILVLAVDETVDLSSGGAGLVPVFVDIDDTMTIGSATRFQQMDFAYNGGVGPPTPFLSTSGLNIIFEYSTGVGTWAPFRPIDGTNSMRNSGVIAWLDADIPAWAPGTGAEFLIRLTRTLAVVSPAAFILNQIQISMNDLYSWDEDAVVSIDTVGFHSSGSANDATIRHDGSDWIITNTVGLSIFTGDIQFNDDTHYQDGVSALFGDGDDALIQHDGADWFLTNTFGDMNITSTGTVEFVGTDVLISTGGRLTLDDYTFPAVDGTFDQHLVTDGAGNISFEAQTSGGLLSAEYRFSDSTVAADPGSGRYRFDTGAYSTVTEIFIDDETSNGVDISNLLTLITRGDRLYFQARTDASKFVVFDVIVDAVDNTGWFTIGVTEVLSGTFLANNDKSVFIWSLRGQSAPQQKLYEGLNTRSLVHSDFTIGSFLAEGVTAVAAGTGAAVFNPTAISDDHPGIWVLRTGITAAGRVFVIGRPGSYHVGVGGVTRVGTWVMTPGTLSDGTDEYVLRAGLYDISIPNTINFGIGFEYQFDQNGGRWQGITEATAESSLDTGTTVVVDTWYYLEFEVNTDGTSVEFFIDQVSVGTLSTAANIPSGTGFDLFYNTHIMKLAGTTSRDFFIDAYYVYQELTR